MRRNKQEVSEKRLLSVAELGHIIGIKPRTIYNKMGLKVFPIKHKKIGRLVRFDIKDVDKYLDSLPDHH
ncbi:MAG: AlpA family phage regulatory protein [candidate division Zixibacteria bacterium]|nr:AlpA family phage regulatory protein [candidate division Zixibacteria bacterium]